MKKISKLKLTQLSKAELAQREMNTLKGGYCVCDDGCSCSCSTDENGKSTQSSAYNNNYKGSTAPDQVYVGGDNLEAV